MAASPTDVATFKSALKKEAVPDFTIICDNYSWKVHSHLFAELSKPFKAIFQEGATKEWHSSVSPILIAHLILWVYTSPSKYGDVVEFAISNGKEPPDLEIGTLMKHGQTHTTRADGTPDPLGDDDHLFVQPEDAWLPETLDARMYLLASKYELDALKDYAATEIEEILVDLDPEKERFLLIVSEIFGFQADDDDDVEQTPNIHTRQIAAQTARRALDEMSTIDPQNGLASPVSDRSRIPKSTNEIHIAQPASLYPIKDSKLWTVLATEATENFAVYQSSDIFKQVMLKNAAFQWEVSNRLHQNMMEEMEKKNEAVLALQAAEQSKKPKAKAKPKKRKEKEMSAD